MPLPSDKLLEIRPDLLATVLVFFGLYLFVKANKSLVKSQSSLLYFISGFLFSASLAIVPKTVFFLLPVLLVVLNKLRKHHIFLGLGILTNFLVVLLFFFLSGKFFLAVYLTTRLASNVTNVLASKFYMRPDIFFYPNDTFYGAPGISVTLIINLFIYFIGSIWGIKHFISSLSHEDRNKSIAEFVFSLAFLINLFAFVKVFPLKHLQYLIPVAPFIAFYFADFLITVAKKIGQKLPFVFIFLFIAYITYLSWGMFNYKSPWTNKPTIDNLAKVLSVVPKDTPILDLTGETIFYPDGYYFCCLPYGQYEEALNFNFPEFESDLKNRATQYVHVGKTDRLGVLPILHNRYIKENFKSVGETGGLNLWKLINSDPGSLKL